MVELYYHHLVEKVYNMEYLNKFEKEVLERLSNKYEHLKEHIPFLVVKSREYTGVGLYMNFEYIKNVERLPIKEDSLGIDDYIIMEGLENELIFELDISDGLMNFLEFVTCGENWDGTIKNYSFESYN